MKYSFILLIVLAISLLGCEKEPEVPFGEPSSKLEGINADWMLVAAQIIDENTINRDSISLTDYYLSGEAPLISFDSKTLEYTVNAQGKKNFFGTGGTWAFDDDEYPTKIILTDAELGTVEVMLTSTIREVDTRLRVNISRDCGGTNYATYFFEYVRK